MDDSFENNFVICIATVNGSGSQTANTVLLKSLFRLGIPVSGKNFFPSNISGMPTWFWIRGSSKGYTGAKSQADIVVSFNPQTSNDDQKLLKPGGFFIYPEGRVVPAGLRADIKPVALPLQRLADSIQASPKIKKLASNMIYVGILCELLGIPSDCAKQVIQDQIGNKTSAIQSNLRALEVGQAFAKSELSQLQWPFKISARGAPKDRILMDGNTAAGLGLVAGGCQFISWYPITPSTSIVEAFSKFAEETRKNPDGSNRFAVVQAEDELSAFSMVLGAGWAGTRAMTATSGPGLSLMAEGAGYAYYAEIPSVIWDVQRLGPSTGLPTRTAQGDVLFAANLSHGDTKHILLFPGTIKECFEFGQVCFDLAERLQQLVIVLSDLDLGMNLWVSDILKPLQRSYDRGLIFEEEYFKEKPGFQRYQDENGDGIAPRTLIGNPAPGAAYFTRGSGHNVKAQYTEKPHEYGQNIERLVKKWETSKRLVVKPDIHFEGSAVGLIYYGSTQAIIEELCDLHEERLSLCRIKAYPFSEEVGIFIKSCDKIYVIEQNRDAQMKTLLLQEFPHEADKLESILHFDGTLITADLVADRLRLRMGHGR